MYVFDKKTGLKAWLSKWNEILVDPIHGTIKHNLQLADYYGCFSVDSKLPSWVPLSVYSMQHRRKDMKFFSMHMVSLGVHLIHTVPVLKKEDLLITFSTD